MEGEIKLSYNFAASHYDHQNDEYKFTCEKCKKLFDGTFTEVLIVSSPNSYFLFICDDCIKWLENQNVVQWEIAK